MIVVCQIIDDDLNYLGTCVGEGTDLWTAMSAAQEQFVMRRSPSDPPPPVRQPLFNYQNGGHHNGPPTATMDPPRPARPAYSPDGRTIFDHDGPRCAEHQIGKPSKRKGAWFCPVKVDGGYCQWVYPPGSGA